MNNTALSFDYKLSINMLMKQLYITVKYGVYKNMEYLYQQHLCKVVVDSAFKLKDRDYLIQSAQQNPIGSVYAVLLNRDAASLRQLSKHRMRQIQAQF